MANKLLVADLVGLTPAALAHAPRLRAIAGRGFVTPISTVLPAVTCSAQASFLTGAMPESHGIVGNGWYFRDLDEVFFWRQSRGLIQGESIFDILIKRGRSSANLFGWYNWNCGAEYSITPRPSYASDGAKYPGIHTEPGALRAEVEAALGPFPLFEFWGPRAGIRASEWIAAATDFVIKKHSPDFVFTYIPHLDYDHQRFGPDDPRSIAAIAALDRVAGDLFDSAMQRGYQVLAFSEYGITDVRRAVMLNKQFRAAGFLRVRMDPRVGELPLFGTSRAFAVCDHQVAHIYIKNPADIPAVREMLISTPGVAEVLNRSEQRRLGIGHANAGELVALAAHDAWFAYNYWLDDALAPDFARTVEIHKKPGYDPAELFTDPKLTIPAAHVAWSLLRKKLGFRYLMKVIPLDPSLVKGSHGLLPGDSARGPVAFGSNPALAPATASITQLRDAALGYVL